MQTPSASLETYKFHFLKKKPTLLIKDAIEGKSYVGVSWGMTSSFWLTFHLVEPNCTFLFLFYVIVWFSP